MFLSGESAPRFKAGYHPRVVDEEHTVILSEMAYVVLQSRLIALLTPWLDGQRSYTQIAQSLISELSPLDVRFGLSQLDERGYLEWQPTNHPPDLAAFCTLLGIDVQVLADRLARKSVYVTAAGDASEVQLRKALDRLGIRQAEFGDLIVVVTDDYLNENLAATNKKAIASGTPWLMVKTIGAQPSIGPLFTPGQGPCWRCLAERLYENPELQIFQYPQSGKRHERYAVASLPSTVEAVVQLSATEILKYLAGNENSELQSTLLTYNALSLTFTRHTLLRREGCRDCGGLSPSPKRVELRDDPTHGLAITRRESEDCAGTFDRLKHHISPITGIVTTVKLLSDAADKLSNVYGAGHNYTLRYGRKSSIIRGLGNHSFGRGLSKPEARTGALCEALERYSGCWRGYERVKHATLRELGEAAIHPNSCLLFSDVQYSERDSWNEREGDFNWIPNRFTDDQAVDWVSVWSLTRHCFRYLPAAFCYYNYLLPDHHDFCRADSNGNAAGASPEDAILHGILELVERDAVSLWWYNCANRNGVNFSSFPGEYLSRFEKEYELKGYRSWALDLTTDFGIPVFAAIALKPSCPPSKVLLGFGSHLNAQVALVRACTELGQAVVQVDNGGSVQVYAGQMEDARFFYPSESGRSDFGDFPLSTRSSVTKDVLDCVDRALQAGLEILVLDQTRGDVGLSVVKVIIPGARHLWARFAPGRLYEVPRRIGWTESIKKESELSSAHLIL